MGYNVGMPILKLDRCNHFGNNENSGNARAVVCEALEERQSSDPDLNRDLTELNEYFGYESGNELADYWEEKADAYRIVDKNGKEKKLRSDAGIGFAGICKPEMAFIETLSADEIKRFMEDSGEVIMNIYEKRGMTIDSMVIQYDEGNPHIHYFGHDEKYQLGKKLGLPLKRALNDTEYPKQMRARGWDIDALKGYDVEATKDMSEEELAIYKEKHIKAKKNKKVGQSSKNYKKGLKTQLKALERDLYAKSEELRLRESNINTEVETRAKEMAKEMAAEIISKRDRKISADQRNYEINQNGVNHRQGSHLFS